MDRVIKLKPIFKIGFNSQPEIMVELPLHMGPS